MAYSDKKKAEVQADFESGTIKSVEELHEKYGISVRTLEGWIIDNGWKKGKNKEVIEKKVEENTLEMMARLGMPKEKVIREVLIEGLESTTQKWVKNPNYEEGAPGDKGEQWLLEIYADQQNRAKYLDQYNKMTGGFTPLEQKIDQTSDIKIGREDLEHLSPEELQVMLKMLDKLGGE